MKVALVASSYLPRPDGLDGHVSKLARALAHQGADVEILTQHTGRRSERVVTHDGVIVRRFLLPVGSSRGAVAPGLWDALRRGGRLFDVAHVHTPHPSFAAAVMRFGPRRKVFTPHAPVKLMVRWPHMRVTRAVVEHAALTLCTSVAESELLAERIPSAADRIAPLAAGVDAEAIAAAAPFVHTGVVVVARGPLERRSRVDRAIGAMASLPDTYRLAVVGAGSALRRLAAHADDLRVDSRVEFHGPVADAELYRWLRTARVVVALADQGSSGVELAEALAAGVPVVASDIPIHREVAEREHEGGVIFVSAEGSPLEVADAILLAAYPRAGFAQNGAHASWESVAAATLDVYKRSLNGHGGDLTRHRAVDPVAGG